jgi:hypothetical protein
MNDNTHEILNWLRKHGYPFELRAGNVLRSIGWKVEHARWYTDLETGKPRELDLYAYIYAGAENPRSGISIAAAIECKSSVGKPWVVFSSPRDTIGFILQDSLVADPVSKDALLCASVHRLVSPTVLSLPELLGHGIVKVHSDNKTGDPTAAFAALRSVVAGARAIALEHEEFALSNRGSYFTGMVILPIVLLDGELFDYCLDGDGQESLRSIDAAYVTSVSTGPTDWVRVLVLRHQYMKVFFEQHTPQLRSFCEALVPYATELTQMVVNRFAARPHSNGAI